MRKRFTVDNEKASADVAIEFMNQINQEVGTQVFSKDDKNTIREAIDATIPGFDPEKGTVVQPNMNEQSSLVARAVGLADLGTAGMDGPKAFLPEGDALFREENLDILEALKNPKNISGDQKEYYRKRMLGWSKFQPKFANGRKDLLEKELSYCLSWITGYKRLVIEKWIGL